MKNSHLTVTDQFCGAGGSSQGVRDVSDRIGGGLEVKLALNHWSLAIETHNSNFPETMHDCTDISACDPRRYPSTNILITSPECTNHSLAKGKKRKGSQTDIFSPASMAAAEERSRATMWDVPRFAEFHNYEMIYVENVVDARYWVMWNAWLKAMECLGYKHKCVYINSMHCLPTPQSRDRMYVVFWKKENKMPNLEFRPVAYCTKCCTDYESFQSWKNPQKKWGKYKQQYVYRCSNCNTIVEPYYYAAFNCIDWARPGQRIGDRTKPLAPNSLRRIQYGLDNHGMKPLIITGRYTSGIASRVRDTTNEVLPTQPGDSSHALFNPFMIYQSHTHSGDKRSSPLTGAMGTQTTKNQVGLVMPGFLLKNYGGGFDLKNSPVGLNEKLGTVTTSDHHSVLSVPFIVENHKSSDARSITDRLGCQTTHEKYGVINPEAVSAFISYYYGTNNASGIHEALHAVTGKDRCALILRPVEKPKIDDCTYRMLQPNEIQKAMAFKNDYIVLGNKSQQVKQLGNAVTPPAMDWLISRGVETFN